ncbi:hypothetical protein Tco_0852464 [Tanacetum coccineum]
MTRTTKEASGLAKAESMMPNVASHTRNSEPNKADLQAEVVGVVPIPFDVAVLALVVGGNSLTQKATRGAKTGTAGH